MLSVGDTILQINGRKVGNLTHHGVERLISQTHATLKIVAQRNYIALIRQPAAVLAAATGIRIKLLTYKIYE